VVIKKRSVELEYPLGPWPLFPERSLTEIGLRALGLSGRAITTIAPEPLTLFVFLLPLWLSSPMSAGVEWCVNTAILLV